MPFWVILYVAGSVAVSAWSHRHDLRRRDAATLFAGAELLGSVCLTIPALGYWNAGIAAWAGRAPLRILLASGIALVLAYLVASTRKTWCNPWLPRRQRRIAIALALAMALLGNGLDAWWGAQVAGVLK